MHLLRYLREAFWRCFSALFGPSATLRSADPQAHQQLILRAERFVYGSAGMEAYESNQPADIERYSRRSLAQFLCHDWMVDSSALRVARSVACFVALPFYVFAFLMRTFAVRRSPVGIGVAGDAVVVKVAPRLSQYIDYLKTGDISQRLWIHETREVNLGIREVAFIIRVIRACPTIMLYPYLMLNIVRWISYYGHIIAAFRCETVFSFMERTPSCSLVTCFLHESGRRHVDLQHGERWFTSDAAFSCFDEIRVWGNYFRNIFHWQRSAAEKIVICGYPFHRYLLREIRSQHQPRPCRMLILAPLSDAEEEGFYACLLRLLECLDKDWEVRIRRHPNDQRAVLKCCTSLRSEDSLIRKGIICCEEPPCDVQFIDALRETRVVAGTASAAMIDAWVAGCKVVHIRSINHKETLMDRYSGSPNVIYADEHADLGDFLRTAAVCDDDEYRRIAYISNIRFEERQMSSGSAAA